jgi:hypothetical protein
MASNAPRRRAVALVSLAATLIALGACAPMPAAPEPAAATSSIISEAPTPPGGPRGAASAAASAAAPDEGVMESARGAVRSSTEWLARGVDSWFGDKPFSKGGSVGEGQLGLSLLRRQDTGTDFALRLNARFRLPNLEARSGYLFIGRDNQREVITDTPAEFSRHQTLLPETNADRASFFGVGFAAHETVDFRLGMRGGLKPYGQARYRQPWAPSERDLVEFRQTLFWSRDDRLGSTTALTYEHAYLPTLVLRWLSAATITKASGKFGWSSSLGTRHRLGEQRVLSLSLLARGEQGSGVDVTDAGIQAKWQQAVHRDWLLGDITIGHFWPRPDVLSPRGRAWAFGAGLQMYF